MSLAKFRLKKNNLFALFCNQFGVEIRIILVINIILVPFPRSLAVLQGFVGTFLPFTLRGRGFVDSKKKTWVFCPRRNSIDLIHAA